MQAIDDQPHSKSKFSIPFARKKQSARKLLPKLKKMTAPFVDIVIPCRNEEATLSDNIAKLVNTTRSQKGNYKITIVDSNSTDNTPRIARKLSKKYPEVSVLSVDLPGRGRAIKHAIGKSKSDIIVYMDEDLSTDLSALPNLITPLANGQQCIVSGDRYHRDSVVTRGKKRSILSRGYSLFARFFLRLGIKDFQCGFKAIRTSTAKKLVAQVQNDNWFFDSELLARAYDNGLELRQIPVTWRENTDSRVVILPAIEEFVSGIDRVAKTRKKLLTPERSVVIALSAMLLSLLMPAFVMNGWANTYYTMAVQAANQNWKAFFFGSLDGANFVTLDKPPLSVWLSALSSRIFGFSSFSILLPHVIAGLLTMLFTYYMVRRYFGTKSAVIAGLSFICMPIAIVVFRYNIPDSIMTVLLVASAYTFMRAIENPKLKWLLSTGILMGFAFNVKMIQALIVLPLFVLLYFVYAQRSSLLRIRDLAITGVVFFVSALWWPIAVWLTPVQSRPYIGGTLTNNIWELIAGYNGLSRFLGTNWRQPTGEKVGAGFGGKVGVLRIFNEGFGSVVAWLIPLVIVAGLLYWMVNSNQRNRYRNVAVLLWSGWVVLHAVVFGLTKGTIHPHYAVVLTPMIAALMGVVYWIYDKEMKQRGIDSPLVIILAIVMAASATILPLVFWKGRLWVAWPAIATVCLALGGLGLFTVSRHSRSMMQARIAFFVLFIAVLFAPGSSVIASSWTAQEGLIISAVPIHEDIKRIRTPESSIPKELKNYLLDNRQNSRWVASTATAYDAAAIQLSTRQPVMTIGGFSGADVFMSLNQYKAFVRENNVRYFIVNHKQSSEIKRCDDAAGNFQSRKRLPFMTKPGTENDGCKVSDRESEKLSTLNITNWAQSHKQIYKKEFKEWEVFDLNAESDVAPSRNLYRR